MNTGNDAAFLAISSEYELTGFAKLSWDVPSSQKFAHINS